MNEKYLINDKAQETLRNVNSDISDLPCMVFIKKQLIFQKHVNTEINRLIILAQKSQSHGDKK